jgi:pimeloyl-ACP methyl ester carboxylesterase
MTDITHRLLQAGEVRLHVAEAGSGPLVLLLHGFPESWYSWRHQLTALAEAGFHAVAVDQRGYGGSDHPAAVTSYGILHLVGDVVCLLDALRERSAVVVGHDWGADVAWHTALLRPDLVRGVIGLSLPHRPRGPRSQLAEMRQAFGDGVYMNYFQPAGRVDAEMAADPRRTFRLMLRGSRGRSHERPPAPIVPAGQAFFGGYPEPTALPRWLSEEDIAVYAAEFKGGFTGALNWYRNLELNWELTAALHGKVIQPPSLYMVGEHDRCLNFPGVREAMLRMQDSPAGKDKVVVLPDVGHWTQQEAPERVSAAIADFARPLS